MFGPDLLVAPNTGEDAKSVWLPEGSWYSLHDGGYIDGEQTVTIDDGLIAVFARAGAIVPKREYAQSTAFIDKETLVIDVYTGADGAFRLVEDDDRTEAWRDGERRVTWLRYDDADKVLMIEKAKGTYEDAPEYRNVVVNIVSRDGKRSLPRQRLSVSANQRLSLTE